MFRKLRLQKDVRKAIQIMLGEVIALLSIFATAYLLFFLGYAMQGG